MWATKKQLRRDAELLKAENEALKAEIKALTTGMRELKNRLSAAQTNAEEVPKLRATVENLKEQIATQNEIIRLQSRLADSNRAMHAFSDPGLGLGAALFGKGF